MKEKIDASGGRALFAAAGVVELVDTRDLGSRGASCGGSTPSVRTILCMCLGSCRTALAYTSVGGENCTFCQ